MTLEAIHSATSSPVLADGATPYDWLGGPTSGQFGQDRALASLSARQAKAAGLLMSGTYGPYGIGSSSSVALTSSLASRLRTAVSGSTLYRQTWKQKATPSGRQYWAHTASAPRTSDSDSTGWPTARAADGEKNVRTLEGSLKEIARKGGPQDLSQAASLAGWATPTSRDHKDGASDGTAPVNSLLGRQVWLTHVAGAERNYRAAAPTETTRGVPQSLSTAEMGSGGQLNPAFSRWLQGYPMVWCEAAIRAHRLTLTTRRKRG
jgi:hypothetical protein